MNSLFMKENHDFLGKLPVILVILNLLFVSFIFVMNVEADNDISVTGDIEVFDYDGITPLTNHDFPLFTGANADTIYKDFFINNTGFQPVEVFWNITSSSISWEFGDGPYLDEYVHHEDETIKYSFGIAQNIATPTNCWIPTLEPIFLNIAEGIKLSFKLYYTGEPATSENFLLTTSFVAKPFVPPSIPVTIDFVPNILNLNNKGKWLSCYIQLPSGYNVNDVDFSSIRLNETIPIDSLAPITTTDRKKDGIIDLFVKFDRAGINDWLTTIDWSSGFGNSLQTTFKVTGFLGDASFEGVQIIKIKTN